VNVDDKLREGFPLLTPNVPFQGFARQCGIQVFRLYATPSPVTESQWRSVMVTRVSPSHPYNAGRAGLRWGGGGWLRMGCERCMQGLCCVLFL
jgi:hypothetical protein